MSTAAAHVIWTVEDFLAWELEQPVRHEFIGGRVYAMAPTRFRHTRKAQALSQALGRQIGPPCEVMVEGPMLVAAGNAFVPDVWVVCSQPDDDATEARDAELVVEVLSPSNRPGEMQLKLDAYLTLPSLVAYLVVDGDSYEAWTRLPGGPWQCEQVKAGDFTVVLHGRTVTL